MSPLVVIATSLVTVGVLSPVAASATPSTYESAVLADLPSVYWRLGDSSGASTLADDSGNSWWTGYSDVALGRPGAVFGDADTAAGLVADSSALTVMSGYSPSSLSVAVWFRTTTSSGGPFKILNAYNASSPGNPIAGLAVQGGGSAIAVVKTSSGTYTQDSTNALTDGAWHQLVMTDDGSTLDLYVDGGLDSSQSVSGSLSWASSTMWALGNSTACGGCSMTGDVDEAAVFDSVLSSGDVAAQYADAAAPAPSCSSTDAYSALVCSQQPVGYWRLGESSTSSAAVDQTSLGNDGAYVSDGSDGEPTLGGGGVTGATDTSMEVTDRGQAMRAPYDPYGHYASPVGSLAMWVDSNPDNESWSYLADDGNESQRMTLTTTYFAGGPLTPVYTASANVRVGATEYSLGGTALISGVWSYVVVTYDGSEIRLWVDGADVDDQAVTGRLAPCVGCSVDVGEPSNCGGCVSGDARYDEVALFDRALTGDEIRAAANLVGPSDAELTGGGDPSSDYQPCQCADPVDTATGFLDESATDLSDPGRGPELDVGRTYDSSQAGVASRVGDGWTDPYAMFVDPTSTGATVKQENGSTITFAQDASGDYVGPTRSQLTLSHNGDGTWTMVRRKALTFTFGSEGYLSSEQDLNGDGVTLAYTGTPSLTTLSTVTDTAGRTLTFTYDGSGDHIASATDSSGREVDYGYDGDGNLTSVIDPAGLETDYSYDGNHLLDTVTDPRGGVTTNSYDGQGRVTSQEDPKHSTTYFDYSTPGTTTITDPRGEITVQGFDENLLMSETRGYGTASAATTHYGYDPVTLGTTSVTDPNGHVSTATFDADGNQLSATDPYGHSSSWTYNSLDEPLTATDRDNTTTTNTYDSNGNILTSATPIDGARTATTTYSYGDGFHTADVTAISDPRGRTTSFSYDTYGQLASTTDPDGNETTDSYTCTPAGVGCRSNIGWVYASVTPRGNVSGATPANFTTTYTYDDDDEQLSATDPYGHATHTSYNGDGAAHTVQDRDGNVTTYDHNADGELVKVINPDATVTRTGYDDDGNVTSQTDGNTHATHYTYDPLNRVETATTPATSAEPSGIETDDTYDPAGNLLTVTQPATGGDLVTTYGYDHDNRMTSISYSDGTTPDVSIDYDNAGRRTSMTDGTGSTSYTYNTIGWLTDVTDGAGDHVGYTYSRDGQAKTIEYPNNETVTRSYDDADQLASVTDWNSHETHFTYSPDGQLSTIGYPNGVTETASHSRTDALSEIADTTATTTLADDTYGRDDNDQLNAVSGSGSDPEPTQGYDYDALNRVDSLTSGGTTGALSYDAADNLTGFSDGTTLGYDAADEATTSTSPSSDVTSYTYSDRGNRTTATDTGTSLTQSYGYDQANRLDAYTDGTTSADYAYNGDGLRALKVVGLTTTGYTWDSVTGAVPLLLAAGSNSFVYGPDGTSIEQIASGGTATYLLHDQHGSTTLLTDSTGAVTGSYTYTPYGATTSHTGATTALRYDGQYQDNETGLYYLQARYYDPATAQFLTRDPLEDETGQPYSYAGDDPIDYEDPSGLDWLDDVGDWTAGFGDTITLGGTEQIRRLINYEQTGDTSDIGVDHCSVFYDWGGHGGLVASFFDAPAGVASFLERRGLVKGGEIVFSKDFRIAPLGGSKPQRWQEFLPHYHRRFPGDGGGIGRHRPWDPPAPGKSWWSRF